MCWHPQPLRRLSSKWGTLLMVLLQLPLNQQQLCLWKLRPQMGLALTQHRQVGKKVWGQAMQVQMQMHL